MKITISIFVVAVCLFLSAYTYYTRYRLDLIDVRLFENGIYTCQTIQTGKFNFREGILFKNGSKSITAPKILTGKMIISNFHTNLQLTNSVQINCGSFESYRDYNNLELENYSDRYIFLTRGRISSVYDIKNGLMSDLPIQYNFKHVKFDNLLAKLSFYNKDENTIYIYSCESCVQEKHTLDFLENENDKVEIVDFYCGIILLKVYKEQKNKRNIRYPITKNDYEYIVYNLNNKNNLIILPQNIIEKTLVPFSIIEKDKIIYLDTDDRTTLKYTVYNIEEKNFTELYRCQLERYLDVGIAINKSNNTIYIESYNSPRFVNIIKLFDSKVDKIYFNDLIKQVDKSAPEY